MVGVIDVTCLEAGKLKAHVATVLPLFSIKEAFDLSEGGHTAGKIVVDIISMNEAINENQALSFEPVIATTSDRPWKVPMR